MHEYCSLLPSRRAAFGWRGVLALLASIAGPALAEQSDVIHLVEIKIIDCTGSGDSSGTRAATVKAETLRSGILQYRRGTDHLERPLKWFPNKGVSTTSYGVRGPMSDACSALVPGSTLVVQEHWNEECDSAADPQKCWDRSRLIGPLPSHANRDLRLSAARDAASTPKPTPSPLWDESQPLSELEGF